jgi:hypothetical protein
MSEIQFMEKPEWVTWEDVRICLNAAHQINKKSGFEMVNLTITTDEFIKKIKDGHCFVAVVDKKVVGVACSRVENRRKWYVRGPVIYHFGDGILPEYRGTSVYFGLSEIRRRYDKSTGVKIQQFLTSEHNKIVIKINQKKGYKLVQFQPTRKKDGNYYQVNMVKWDDGCPFPDWFLKIMFNLSMVVSKVFFKRNS